MRVAVDVDLGDRTVNAGEVFFAIRGGEVTSSTFNYSPDFLADSDAYSIDPALPLFRGAHNVAGIPGAFSDCSPDRWGQTLIKKRIQADARREGQTPPAVTKVDYLLRVDDLTRQGALRFSVADGPYLDPASDVPKLIELPRLLSASDAYARDPDALADIKTRLDAGSATLGGARPKASIRDGDTLHIAKFPHHMDEWDSWAGPPNGPPRPKAQVKPPIRPSRVAQFSAEVRPSTDPVNCRLTVQQ